jgi:hypothetical protein
MADRIMPICWATEAMFANVQYEKTALQTKSAGPSSFAAFQSI